VTNRAVVVVVARHGRPLGVDEVPVVVDVHRVPAVVGVALERVARLEVLALRVPRHHHTVQARIAGG